MLLEGRKQPRTPERLLVQISAVYDLRVTELVSVENVSLQGTRVNDGETVGTWVSCSSHAPQWQEMGKGASHVLPAY